MLLIHSSQIPEQYISKLKSYIPNLLRLLLAPDKNVYASIAAHPDIFFFQLNRNTLVHSPRVPKNLLKKLKAHGAKLMACEKNPAGKYPDTASLNAARLGKFIIHNTDITDPVIKKEAVKQNLTFIHTGQGYAGCSVVPAGEKALITCDEGIGKAAAKAGLEVLCVRASHVKLPGQKHGFIGGACGKLPDGKIVFLGDIEQHPNFEKIHNFLKKFSAAYISLKGLPLLDAGSLIFL